MSTPLINFESSWEKASAKEHTRDQRKKVLDKAKADFLRHQRKQEEAEKRGEGTWMLPELDEQIKKAEEELASAKKKKKKHKKKKKSKKHSSSGSESEEQQPQWVEKNQETEVEPAATAATAVPVRGPTLQRDSWMVSPFDVIPTVSRDELRAKKQVEDEKQKEIKEHMENPGQHERELNPYWKDGGSGLPSDQKCEKSASASNLTTVSGDAGYSWLLKAYKRCEEQAKEEGRSLEQVAGERYGSLKILQKMLDDAREKSEKAKERFSADRENRYSRDKRRPERRASPVDKTSSNKDRRDTYHNSKDTREREKHRNDFDRTDRNERQRFRKPGDSDDESDTAQMKSHSKRFEKPRESSDNNDEEVTNRGEHKEERRDRRRYEDKRRRSSSSDSSEEEKRRSQHTERGRREEFSRERKTFKKPGISSEEDDRTVRRHRNNDRRDESGRERGKFKKPGDSSDDDKKAVRRHRRDDKREESGRGKGKFKKPGMSSEDEAADRYEERIEARKVKEHSPRRRHEMSRPSWRKKGYSATTEEKKKTEAAQAAAKAVTSSSSSESSSDEEEPEEAPLPILTEEEKNQLGAKLLKAEIMGDTELVNKLKAQLNAAHQQPVQKPRASARKHKEEEEEEEVAVLTRTTATGLTVPLGKRKHPIEPTRGRRKKEKINTHDDEGKRMQYFQDDDKFSLQDLVSREKQGTTEDSNIMFARLASKVKGQKADDEFQVDDAMITAATKKMSDSRQEDRERKAAIFEHKKIASAMEKCEFCFNNYPKHLMVSMGKKAFLALPRHRSLAEGQCYIVPIHHSGPGTTLDEDVWEEIQFYRQSLVKYFESQEEDCVFMETSKYLQHHPHMHLECIPMDREVGDMAPIYFKKALLESESEWAQNKQVVDLKGRDVRRAIPKGLPYFSVDFGGQSGFAHVIEDEKSFPIYFGREVVGGMIDADHQLWRKPHKEDFETQRQKVLTFAKQFKTFDWTKQNVSS